MKRTTPIALVMFAAVALPSFPALAADATLHEVYQAAAAGNLKQADSMMAQVLRDHPNSAKAHYVEAQVLAREGRVDAARTELASAERLQPGLPFAKPETVRELQARLGAAPHAAALQGLPARPGPGMPWGMLALGALLAAAVFFFIRALNRQRTVAYAATGAAPYGPAGGMAPPYGTGGVGPMAPPSPGMGSGILGGLATGAAVGAGVVAGEALMHRLLDGGQSGVVPQASPPDVPLQSDYDMGGSDFGIADGSSWDDASSGGDDWS